eukprot:TRINITY_DN2051_c0_g1_i6.p1 TRINITY_DN2051_c0_g1~~TRINITY_DN2051_c0_g1_i6.p1  ORF type:complete len:412 (-),score=83.76 TRINITY_DN2051_c0_g1_i6:317-1552(-)
MVTPFTFSIESDRFESLTSGRSISAPPSLKNQIHAQNMRSFKSIPSTIPSVRSHKAPQRTVSALGNIRRTSTLVGVNWKFLDQDPSVLKAKKRITLQLTDGTHLDLSAPENEQSHSEREEEAEMSDALENQMKTSLFDEEEKEIIHSFLQNIHQSHEEEETPPKDQKSYSYQKPSPYYSKTNNSIARTDNTHERDRSSPLMKPITASELISSCKKDIGSLNSEDETSELKKKPSVRLTPMQYNMSVPSTPVGKTPTPFTPAPMDEGRTPKPLHVKVDRQSSAISVQRTPSVAQLPMSTKSAHRKPTRESQMINDFPLSEELAKLKKDFEAYFQEDSAQIVAGIGEPVKKKSVHPRYLAGLRKLEIREVTPLELPVEWERCHTIESELGRRKRTDESTFVQPKLQPTESQIV